MATVLATAAGAVLLLALCLLLFGLDPGPFPYAAYVAYVALIGVDVILGPIRLSQYRYQKRQIVVN